MAGYRCVNFSELCRLCSSAGTNNTQIFSDESLQKKITECLPITLDKLDKLPKVICSQCLDYVQTFSDFRSSCSKAQKMLESCLNSSKLRNGGQVYIKDEVTAKKVLKPIQTPTKLVPNLCNFVTSSPKPVKRNVLTPNPPDFLSSIMQAVGIQTTNNDEAAESVPVTFSQSLEPQNVPQYTLTLDSSQALKTGQFQYKIENLQPPQTQIVAKDQKAMSVDEFLKLKKSDEPKNKKPKFNLILQTSPAKQPQQQQKSQIQIHNIEKISPAKQLVLPIIGASQAPAPAKPQPPPFAYVQMKIQPNADGQLTLTPASTVQPVMLSQFTQPAPPPQPQITVTQVPVHEQTDSQTQTPAPVKDDDEDESFTFDDDIYEEEPEVKEEPAPVPPAPEPTSKKLKISKPLRKIKVENLTELQSVHQDHSEMAQKQLDKLTSFNTKRAEAENAEKPADLNLTVCDVCKKVFKRKEFLMQHLKSHIGLRPFKCDDPNCNKSFSRKEHLLRHVVSHTGKKMFNCDVCQKLFSRKDNLNKHRRIHPETGQQSIRHNCGTCSKGFAHRSQLAKHQLSCGKSEVVEVKQEIVEENKQSQAMKKAKLKTEKKPPETPPKPATSQNPQQPHSQILTILQQSPQQQTKLKTEPQQIILSMSQAQAMLQTQQPKNAVYTFPTNLILNSNGTFMTSAGEVFKFDNQ